MSGSATRTTRHYVLDPNLTIFFVNCLSPLEAWRHDLPFSISHSDEFWAIAYALGAPKTLNLGLDIEFPKEGRNMLGIAQRYFHEGEQQFLAACAPNEIENLFHEIWTTKEALAKLSGEGLAETLSAIDLSKPETMPQAAIINYALTPSENEELFLALAIEGIDGGAELQEPQIILHD